MIDIGVARPSAHGQAMISTLTAATIANGSRGCGPIAQPEGGQGDGDHDRHEHRRDLVDQSLDRSTGPLRLGDQVDDPGQGRVGAQASGLHHQAAALDDRAADDPVTGALVDRNRLAGDHRLVHIRVTIDHGAVGRHLLARPHPTPIAQLQLGGRHVGLGAVGPDAVRGGR